MNYYQHHIGDFNNATRHLSLIERAIYRDLLDMYYDTEHAIDASDLNRLARRLNCKTEDQMTALSYVLDEFFTLNDGVYVNNRCEREIAEYRGKRVKASEAGKASAKKRAEKKQQDPSGGSSNGEHLSNECSTGVEQPSNQNLTGVQPTINHKPLTSNHEPVTNIIDSSGNAPKTNFALVPIQFSQYQPMDHKRYSLLECVDQYPLQQDFIDYGVERFSVVNHQDMISMFTNFGDFFASKGESAKNTPSMWLVKWFTWIQNNKDDARRKREDDHTSQKPKNHSSAAARTSSEVNSWMDEINTDDSAPLIRDVHEVEGVKYA